MRVDLISYSTCVSTKVGSSLTDYSEPGYGSGARGKVKGALGAGRKLVPIIVQLRHIRVSRLIISR